MKKNLLKSRKLLMLIIVLVSAHLSIHAQETSVTGLVSDSNGEAIPGVSVVEKGTTNGTITDVDGNYSLRVMDSSSLLVFSFIGMRSQEISIGAKQEISVVLQDEMVGVDEVVVIGYGAQKKANLTGAVGSMKIDEAVNQPVTNTSQLLSGKMAGVQLTQGSGQPGRDGATIRIRGIGTSGNSNPMVIVDGMERELGDVAPSDIESISVLKDAASAAIYGSRAANGVILITTKKGKSGEMKVNYNGYYGWQEATVLPDLADAPTYAKMINEATGSIRYSDEDIQKMIDGSDPDHYSNTNWGEELFRTSPITNHYLSFTGGSEKTNYMISSNFLDQEGTMLGSEYKRYNARINVNSQVKSWLKIGMNVDGSVKKIDEPVQSLSGDDGLMRRIVFDSPVAPVKYTNGDWGVQDGAELHFINNVVFRSQLGENITDQYRFNAKAYANMDLSFITEGLSFETSFGYNYYSAIVSKFSPTFELKDAEGSVVVNKESSILTNSNVTSNKVLNENILRYTKTIGDHSINVLAGHSTQSFRKDAFDARGEGFPNNELHELDAASAEFLVGGSASELSLQSFFGRVGYIYKDKYLFEANVRRDGSSRFPSNQKYGTFPSFSLGWRISQEEFFKPLEEQISNLKLRASWGKLGNQEIGGYYPQAQTYDLGQDYIFVDGELKGGAAITSLANNKLKWETTESYNVGLDVGLYNKLNLSVDYFKKNTLDLLLRLPLPETLGNVSFPFQNAGEVLNRGFEVSAQYNDRAGDVNYFVGFNLTKIHNEWVDLEGTESYPTNRIHREGEALFSYYGLEQIGIFQSEEEIANAPTQSNATSAGDMIFKDQITVDTDGDGIADATDGKITDDDRVIIGNPIPEFSFGFSGGLDYKGLDFAFAFQGVANVDRYVGGTGNHAGLSDRMNWISEWENRWTEDNPSTQFPRLGTNTDNNKVSSFYIWDASYIRLKNIELGYSLPKGLLGKSGIEKLRFYVSAQNLFTISDFNHWDPERSIGNVSSESYPLSKSYTLGVNVSF